MQIVSTGDSLQEMSNPGFSEISFGIPMKTICMIGANLHEKPNPASCEIRKNIDLLSSELDHRVVKVKFPED